MHILGAIEVMRGGSLRTSTDNETNLLKVSFQSKIQRGTYMFNLRHLCINSNSLLVPLDTELSKLHLKQHLIFLCQKNK